MVECSAQDALHQYTGTQSGLKSMNFHGAASFNHLDLKNMYQTWKMGAKAASQTFGQNLCNRISMVPPPPPGIAVV